MALKDRLQARRTARGLTQKALAEAVGITPASLNLLEKGTNKMPRADVALRLAEVLGVSPRWLVLGQGPATGALETDLLARVLAYAEQSTPALGVTLSPARRAALIAALYQLAVDPEDEDIDRDLNGLIARLATAADSRD